MLDDSRCRLGRPFYAARPFRHALKYANLTLAQWRCVSGPVDDQGLQWQSKRFRCGGCALHEVLQQLSLRTAYVADCKSNLLVAGRWLLSNLFVASMLDITLGARDADQPPLSPRSVSSAVAWMPASTIGVALLTASVPARQCSSAPSKRRRAHARTKQALYFAESCDSTNLELLSTHFFSVYRSTCLV
ncbi:hypothetical protein HPB50_016588 [Hyalomma asiaticum]|uniref:Uncharacterized protein n=1 Tax=Hyalomma asiaticum TaxID=266040 RepID=A0ACB7TJK8_HYAAI|nr:hypothetical protein HPB50_016588 [Hyalomma asiaticum]